MASQTSAFTEAELENAGLLGNGFSGPAVQVLETMKKRPDLLSFSIFVLECINAMSNQHTDHVSPTPTSNLSASHSTVVSEYAPDDYEKRSYYNGVTEDGDHPELLYRSDFRTTLFPKPAGRHFNLPVKSLRGVHGTPLNFVWHTVGPQIRDLIKARKISYTSIDPARLFTHAPLGEGGNGSLGPVVIWIGVRPGSTSSNAAHEVSQEILALLLKNGVEDVVVEWREAVVQRLSGPPLMRHVSSDNPTHYTRRFLTPLLGVPLATEGMETEDAQGTLTFWFHENRDKDGNPSDKVYGVSNCHVLRKNTTVKYEHRAGAPKDHVRVCGMRRFQRGLDEIKWAIAGRALLAEVWAREIIEQGAKGSKDAVVRKSINRTRRNLDEAKEDIAELETLYKDIRRGWSDLKHDRNIGHVQFAEATKVDVDERGAGTGYTSDWAAFLAAEAKVKDRFEGNIVDLGSKYTPPDLVAMFCPLGYRSTTFTYPVGRKLRIEGCATEEDLANPTELDTEGQRCLIVGKDGNSTDLTIGRYAGLVSFIQNEVGLESVELGIYNSGLKSTEAFSAKGDSGSLVWYIMDGKAHIVGQLHSGNNKGGSTSNHVTYCTPGWYLLEQIKKRFKHAEFYHTTWEI